MWTSGTQGRALCLRAGAQLQSIRLRRLGRLFRRLIMDWLRSCCWVEVKAQRTVAPGLVIMLLQCIAVKPATPFIEGCSGQVAVEKQDMPCTYLAHHELVSVTILSNMCIAQNPTNPGKSCSESVRQSQYTCCNRPHDTADSPEVEGEFSYTKGPAWRLV